MIIALLLFIVIILVFLFIYWIGTAVLTKYTNDAKMSSLFGNDWQRNLEERLLGISPKKYDTFIGLLNNPMILDAPYSNDLIKLNRELQKYYINLDTIDLLVKELEKEFKLLTK